MTEWFSGQISTNGFASFAPRGLCYDWHVGLISVQVICNAIIGVSLLAVAGTLAYLLYAGKALPFKRAAAVFGTFIIAVAATHLLDVLLTWHAFYWLDAAVRVTAALAAAAAALLAPALAPRLLSLMRGVIAARQRGIELAAAVESLEGMYETTKELERLKTQFFANISHELRTPLTLVLGPTERLLRAQNLTDEQRRDAELVLRNARTLLRHVNDLLDVSRLEAGKLEPTYGRCDLSKLVRRAASYFDSLASERGMRFVVEAPETLPSELDPELLQRVLLNLLANAFKFTPAAGQIRISLKDLDQKRALVEVADSGPGVRPEHRSLIFERFQQADSSSTRRFGGAGLGLAIAKDLVELHAGSLSVADAPEGGAVFSVDLPTRAPAGRSVRDSLTEGTLSIVPEPSRYVLDELWTREHQSDSFRPLAGEKQRPLVLVVEDNADMNRFVCETLAVEYRTESALDGRTGLEKALRRVPDLILTDLMMPGMSGDQLVQAIRNSPELDDTPVVLLSARSDDALRARLLREGAQDFMLKPFAADELRARVANLISMKRARQVLQKELNAQMIDLEHLARELAHQKREMHAALESMRSAREHAEEASRFKSGFLTMVSQELRTPMAALALQLERLQRSTLRELPHDKQVLIQRMGSSVGRLYALIEGLLQYARIESGRFSVRTEVLDVGHMASEVLDELRTAADERGLELCLDVPSDLPGYEGDRELLRLILLHLVENGLKFTEKGQVSVAVSFDERSCRLTVADSGPGIPREQQAHIFRPFEPTEPRRHMSGGGLGLALVRQMVDALGGSITLSSRVGHGTKFSVRLPHRNSSAFESPFHATVHA
ncbi:MAG: ATP-binding protein [Polyangiales bacterium]